MSSYEFTTETAVQSNRRSPRHWIQSYVWTHKWLIVTLMIGAFGNAALASAIPIYTGKAFDAALTLPSTESIPYIGYIAILIIVSQVVRSILQLGRNFSSELLGQRIERDTREELYVSLLGKSMTFHALQPVGDTMARATNDVREINRMFNPGMNLVVGSSNFLLMPLVIAPFYHWELIFTPLLFIVTYALSLVHYMAQLNPVTEESRNNFGAMNSRLAEAIDGIETVKGSAQETAEIALFSSLARKYRDTFVTQGKIEARFLPMLLMGITQTVGFAQGIWLLQRGVISVGDLISFTGLLTLFGFPTFVSLFAFSQVSSGLAGAKRILSLINAETKLDKNSGGYAEEIHGAIQFNDVSFGYTPDQLVLEKISFSIKPGQTIAIVGHTGSGKTSLTGLINRTYDAQSGSVSIDGHDVRDWDLERLRQQISIIEQDIFLFSRTIKENIAFGVPNALDADIEKAAKAAEADQFIRNFKDGYDTLVGERGVTLSGGQKQRIALARAFLTQPKILILDDSTSAIDSATEDRIQQAIQAVSAGRTTILITHRLSQIRWADQLILLQKGKLLAVGTHEELLQKIPSYRKIFIQSEGKA